MSLLNFLKELEEAVEDLRKQRAAQEQYMKGLKNKRRYKK